MKAILSSFGRKSSAQPIGSPIRDSSSQHKDPHKNSARILQANGHEAQGTSFRQGSHGTAGDIGAAPITNHARTEAKDVPFIVHTDWTSRLAGSIRGTSLRKKERAKLSSDPNSHKVQDAQGTARRHPPSSFRDPAAQRSGPVASLYDTVAITPASEPSPSSISVSSSVSRSASLSRGPSTKSTSFHESDRLRAKQQPLLAPRTLRPFSSHGEGSRYDSPIGSTARPRTASRSRESPHREAQATATPNVGLQPNSTKASHNADVPASAMTSEDLAAKLNELAVANADGLLSNDEYRTLRTGLFENMMQADGPSMQMPQEPNLDGIGTAAISGHGHVSSSDLADGSFGGSSSSIPNAQSQPIHPSPEVLGTRHSTLGSVSSFFKRSGAVPVQKQASGDSQTSSRELASPTDERRTMFYSATSLLSSGDGHSGRPSSSFSHASNQARSTRASTLSRFRSGSQSKRLQADALAADMERSYSAARSARSLRATSMHDVKPPTPSIRSGPDRLDSSAGLHHGIGSSIRRGSEDGGSGADLFGANYADKPSAEIRAEIAVVQAEGHRLLETFDGLEQTVIGKYKLDYAALKRAVDEVKGSVGATSLAAAGPGRMPPPPSSYRAPRALSLSRSSSGQASSTDAHTDDAASAHRSSAAQPRDGIGHPPWLSGDLEPAPMDAEAEALKAELREVVEKRERVVHRYEERLAFLRSKLRSATIREGLLK